MRYLPFVLCFVSTLVMTLETRASSTVATEECYQNAADQIAVWTSEGLPEDEIERRGALALESCAGPDINSALAMMMGAAQMDARLAALGVLDGSLLPRNYVDLVRDRSRKVRDAQANGDAEIWAEADLDGDLVADQDDECPDTPPLHLTDEAGCEIEFPEPDEGERDPAPPEWVIAILGQMGIMHNAACDDAPLPAIPVPLQIGWDTPTDLSNIRLQLSQVQNQPAGCPVFYEVRSRHVGMRDGGQNQPFGVIIDDQQPLRYTQMLFRESEDTEPSVDSAVFLVNPTTTNTEGRLMFKEGWAVFAHTTWQVRAVNGNGRASAWSQRAVSEPRFFQ